MGMGKVKASKNTKNRKKNLSVDTFILFQETQQQSQSTA